MIRLREDEKAGSNCKRLSKATVKDVPLHLCASCTQSLNKQISSSKICLESQQLQLPFLRGSAPLEITYSIDIQYTST